MASIDLFDFSFERVDLRRMRIRNKALDDGDTLDQLGNALSKQHRKSNHDQRFRRPLRQSAGTGGLLVDGEGFREEGNAGHQNNDRERQEKKRVTDKLDRVAQPARQLIVHDVDADVFVVAQCP